MIFELDICQAGSIVII